MASKAPRGFTAGIQNPSTPSQGTGSHSPTVTSARVITAADHPGILATVPTMAPNSTDGVVTRPRGHRSQGWLRNEDVKQVEI